MFQETIYCGDHLPDPAPSPETLIKNPGWSGRPGSGPGKGPEKHGLEGGGLIDSVLTG